MMHFETPRHELAWKLGLCEKPLATFRFDSNDTVSIYKLSSITGDLALLLEEAHRLKDDTGTRRAERLLATAMDLWRS